MLLPVAWRDSAGLRHPVGVCQLVPGLPGGQPRLYAGGESPPAGSNCGPSKQFIVSIETIPSPMLAATLDTSCALNFLGHDSEADDALIDLVAAAMDGRLDLRVTEQAFEEVGRTSEETTREQRLSRLRTFGRVELPVHQVRDRDDLAERLKAAVFPASRAGSRTDEHNRRDCLQLATHAVVGRDVFCTRDKKLLKRAESARGLGVTVLSPVALLKLVQGQKTPEQLPSVSSLAVRDADSTRTRARSATAGAVGRRLPGLLGMVERFAEEGSRRSNARTRRIGR